MKRLLFFLFVLLITKSAQADVWMTQIDSCGILSATVSTPITTAACEGDSIELSATVYSNVTAQWYKDGLPFGMPNASTVYATQSGLYHLEVTNALLQCSHSYDDIPLQINPLPAVYAGEDFTVCAGAYVEFYASGALDYVWSNGVSDTYGTLVYESGAISVIGTNALGCSNSDTLMATILPSVIYFYDADGDGFGDVNFPGAFCAQPPSFVANSNDCNDSNFSVNENASELCNNMDDDCDNLVDEGFNLSNYFIDLDSDGFGNVNSNIIACFQPIGYVSDATDCNDDDFIVNSNALELCNDVDDNCNGLVDDGLVFTNYYVDFDSDGFGSINTMQNSCFQPAGYVANALDCNDASLCVNAAAIEICNGLDDDCNGVADNGIVFATFYADVDGDTYGDPATGQDFCLIPDGMFVDNGDDCDDSNALVNPLAVEIWENGIDDDCDPSTSDVGVEELSVFDFNVFPNPVQNVLTITSQGNELDSIHIYNAVGTLISALNPLGLSIIIDISEWSAGYYVVRVGQTSKTVVKL